MKKGLFLFFFLLLFFIIYARFQLTVHSDIALGDVEKIPFNRFLAEKVVAAVKSGKIVPDSYGVADIPPSYHLITAEGLMTITPGREGLQLIYFPTRFIRYGARGFLYCSRPLQRTDMIVSSDGSRAISILSERSRDYLGPKTHHYFVVVPLSRELNPHWWRVEDTDKAV